MNPNDIIKKTKQAMIDAGSKGISAGGVWGPLTSKEAEKYDFTVSAKPKLKAVKPIAPLKIVPPAYPSESPFHPRFEKLLSAPYTHIHPFDCLRSVAGESEIPGDKDNALIAHFHEHAGNLGTHSEKADYHDEVPHCSSAWNWAADMCGCEKSNNALASSWEKYPEMFGGKKFKKGDTLPQGTLICLDGHITSAASEFKWTGKGNFPGFGSNQGNSIKTSNFAQSRIKVAFEIVAKEGTVLAPIGILGLKPVPEATGSVGESTR